MNLNKNCPVTTPLVKSSAIIVALGLSAGMALAAGTASDTASNYAPGSWSTTPANLGSGFGAWNIIASPNGGSAGTYLDSGSSIKTGGYSWGTYANNSSTANISISRAFTAGNSTSSSLYNQTFSFDLSSDGVGPSQGLLSAEIGTAFLFAYNGAGSDNFTLSVDGGASTALSAVNFTALHAGLTVSLAVSGALNSSSEAYTFTVSPFAGGSPLYTSSGTFDSSAYNTSSFNYLDSNTTGNGYFNNLNITPEIVPEPSTMALAGLSGFLTLLALRRRK